MGLQGAFSGGTKPVPGGKSQKGASHSPLPGNPKGKANVGRGRGVVGGGTPDVMGRSASQQTRNAKGNYGGGYAGVTKATARASSRPGADRRG